VVENGTQITPGTLSLGTGSGATLEFNNLTNTTTAPIAAGSVSAASPITININSGVFKTIGQQFPLFSWTSGSAPAVTLGTVSGAAGTLSTNGNSIVLTISSTPYVWTGVTSGSWDNSTAGNWAQSGNPVVFSAGALALFDDTATGQTNVTINGVVQPASVTIDNNSLAYSITSSSGNDIGGSATLTKSGTSLASLAGGANTFSGGTTVSGGILSVSTLANSGSASDLGAPGSSAANLVINGGTLQYTGNGASIDHLFTVGPSGGALDASGAGALSLTNTGAVALNGSGPHTLILTGTNSSANTLAPNVANSSGGATAVTKDNVGTWVLTGTNTYTGLTTVNNGVLQIGAGGGSGTIGSGNILDNANLTFDLASTLTVGGAITGTGSVTNNGTGTLILNGNNNYAGVTAVNAGTLQLGNGGTSGTLNPNQSVVLTNNATFNFDTKTALTLSGYGVGVLGQGNLIASVGTLAVIDNATYSGWTLINSGATFQPCYGNEGEFVSSVVTNNGTLKFIRQDNAVFGYSNNIVGSGKVVKDNNNANSGDITLSGTNTYTGGTWIAGGGILIGDGQTVGAGSLVGPVIFTNTATAFLNTRYLTFDRPDNFTFTNNIIGAVTDGSSAGASGDIVQNGPGNLTLTGNNTFVGGTTIAASMLLQVGAGTASGSIGTGGVADGGTLVFDRPDSITFAGAIADNSASGSVVQFGTGTLTLTGGNSYTGPTTVSNGTLVVSTTGTNSVAGDLDIEGGTVISGSISSLGKLTIGGNLNIDSGTLVATLNKSLAQSNTVVQITNFVNATTGTIIATGGTLKLLNAGPLPAVGEKYYIFSEPVTGGNSLTIVSPGFTVQNNLSTDGSVTITGVSPAPSLTASLSGTSLTLSWPAAYTGGVHVQSMTNSLAKGLTGTNWVTIAGTDASDTYQTTIVKTNPVVFYRLTMP
jgi:autotransporter-associated beta strand protein